MQLHDLLGKLADKNGSDLHLTLGSPPRMRVNGQLLPIEEEPLTASDTKRLVYSILTESQKHIFEVESELDFSFSLPGLSRYRGNIFMQKGAVGAAIRVIPTTIKTIDDLHLPPILKEMVRKPRGLILITGPTGSGKSTTLAAVVDQINTERAAHIMTIEDPIEFVHMHKKSLINQREVVSDTKSFQSALKHVLRQDPDVVLVGEMRDRETMETALTIAETGHITFGTLHTNSTLQTIDRIIDVFEPVRQPQIRSQLSLVLELVLCQQLIPRVDQRGMVMAMEIMVPTPAIRNLIRENKVHQIYSSMQAGQGGHGMKTMNQSICDLYAAKMISYAHAVESSSNMEELQMLMTRAGLAVRSDITKKWTPSLGT